MPAAASWRARPSTSPRRDGSAAWCIFIGTVFSHVPPAKVREVSHMLKAIHAQESRDAADRKARAIIDNLRAARMNTAADLVERSVQETLTYYAFPDIHWQKIRTNNPLERIMREIRRRTRVVGAFPDGQSCLNLAAARLRYIAGTTWSAKCYMNMRPLYQPQVMQTSMAPPTPMPVTMAASPAARRSCRPNRVIIASLGMFLSRVHIRHARAAALIAIT